MRENIGLFHGKRKDNGEWVEGYLFDDNAIDNARFFIGGLVIEEYEGPCCDDWKIGPSFHEVIPETIGECTNVPDKNGKLIFEGDILQSSYHPIKLIVAFKDGVFYLIGTSVSLKYANQLEVIGNIHDTPEPPKGKDKNHVV